MPLSFPPFVISTVCLFHRWTGPVARELPVNGRLRSWSVPPAWSRVDLSQREGDNVSNHPRGRTWFVRVSTIAAVVGLGLSLASPAMAGPNPYGQQFQAVHSGKCLDLTGADPTDGTPIQQWSCLHNPNQGWTDGGATWDSYFVFRNAATGKCIDGFRGYQGADVVEWTCDGTLAQRWVVERPVSGNLDLIRFKNSDNLLCLDVRGASTGNGAHVQLWKCLSAQNQYWH